MTKLGKLAKPYRIERGKHFRLKDFDPADTGKMESGKDTDELLANTSEAGGVAGHAVRAGSLGVTADFSGDGCGGERWGDQARDVGRESSGMRSAFF